MQLRRLHIMTWQPNGVACQSREWRREARGGVGESAWRESFRQAYTNWMKSHEHSGVRIEWAADRKRSAIRNASTVLLMPITAIESHRFEVRTRTECAVGRAQTSLTFTPWDGSWEERGRGVGWWVLGELPYPVAVFYYATPFFCI